MTLSKQHQVYFPGQETGSFLVIAFSTAAVLSAVIFIWLITTLKYDFTYMKNIHLALVILGTSGSAVFGNLFTLILAGMIPSVIQFPTVNGGVIILSTLASVLIFKEKLTGKGITGLCTGIAALVLLSAK